MMTMPGGRLRRAASSMRRVFQARSAIEGLRLEGKSPVPLPQALIPKSIASTIRNVKRNERAKPYLPWRAGVARGISFWIGVTAVGVVMLACAFKIGLES